MLLLRFFALHFLYCICDSYNILVFFTHPGKSHFVIYENLFSSLAAKGHNVTVISYYPKKALVPNYRDVSLIFDTSEEKSREFVSFEHLNTSLTNLFWIENLVILSSYYEINCKMGYESENFRRFLKENNQFDVILMQYFISDCFVGVLRDLKSPFIGKFWIDFL